MCACVCVCASQVPRPRRPSQVRRLRQVPRRSARFLVRTQRPPCKPAKPCFQRQLLCPQWLTPTPSSRHSQVNWLKLAFGYMGCACVHIRDMCASVMRDMCASIMFVMCTIACHSVSTGLPLEQQLLSLALAEQQLAHMHALQALHGLQGMCCTSCTHGELSRKPFLSVSG